MTIQHYQGKCAIRSPHELNSASQQMAGHSKNIDELKNSFNSFMRKIFVTMNQTLYFIVAQPYQNFLSKFGEN